MKKSTEIVWGKEDLKILKVTFGSLLVTTLCVTNSRLHGLTDTHTQNLSSKKTFWIDYLLEIHLLIVDFFFSQMAFLCLSMWLPTSVWKTTIDSTCGQEDSVSSSMWKWMLEILLCVRYICYRMPFLP